MNTEGLSPACAKLLHEKSRRKLTFSEIASELNHDEVWTAALFYGRASPSLKDIHKLAQLLNLSAETLQEDFRTSGPPVRHIGPEDMLGDPVTSPLSDAIRLYAPAIRSVVWEQLGDGSVSLPHTKVKVETQPTNPSHNIKVVLESKYVPFQSW
ncbi:Cyanate hydratase [Coemansia sp. RSA 2336]|nr:Cyanate hydratase [Coemansia sp. RSA 2336]